MCQGNDSGIIGYVKDNVLLRVEGDPESPPCYGKICVKSQSSPFVPINPNRVLKPMIRTNPEKGVGIDPKWKEISWEEAYDIIIPKIKKIREENPLKMVINTFDYPSLHFAGPLMLGFGAQFYFGGATWCGWYHNPCYQYHLSFFREADYERCNYLLLWGTQSGHIIDALPVSSAKKLADARERGCKVVVIDPICTPCAGRADEWVPIKPGTDGMLGLCFINLLINDYGLYDKEFIKTKTNGPYLVGADELYIRDQETNKPLVWDEDKNEAVHFDQASGNLALTGKFTVNGQECHPSFELIRNHVKKYTVEKTAEITTIPAETIRRIVKEYGEAARIGSTIVIDGQELPYRPATLLTGKGTANHRRSMHTIFAIEMINVLIGGVNVPGGVLGIGTSYKKRWSVTADEDGINLSPNSTYWHFGAFDSYPARPVNRPSTYNLFELTPCNSFSDNFFPIALSDPRKFGLDYDIEFMVTSHTNPMSGYISPFLMGELLKKIKFILGFATEKNEGTEMCDLVLPNAHWTERYDPMANMPFKFQTVGESDWYWFFRRPLIKPPDPSIKHWVEIMLEIVERAGCTPDVLNWSNILWSLKPENAFDPEKKYTFMEMNDAYIKDRHGIGIDYYEKSGTQVFREKKSIDEAYPGPFVPGRYNIYMEYWKRAGEDLRRVIKEMGLEKEWDTDDYKPLLDWEPGPSFNPVNDYDLHVVNYKAACHTFTHTMVNPLTLEIGHTYPWLYGAMIHPAMAKKKGIKDGDPIWIESEYGYRTKGNASLTEGIHPDCIGVMGLGGRLTHGEPVGRGVGPHWNSLFGQDLSKMDKMNSSLDSAIRVKIYKV
jgi:anaerobic selenocysteine-containing dehydrogenase